MSTIARISVPVERVDTLALEVERLYGAIMAKAYDYFLERGSIHGYDADDWMQAENDLTTKPAFELAHDNQDFVVEMTLPEAEVTGLRVRLTSNEMLVTSDDGGDGRRIFRIVHFPETIDWAGVDAEIAGNMLRVVAAIGEESEARSYAHSA